ncbi:hypothetical protein ACRAWF_18535 [Streptomyces sp. L7]
MATARRDPGYGAGHRPRPLSVLDLVTVGAGRTATDALRTSVRIAKPRRDPRLPPLLGRRAPLDAGRRPPPRPP